MTAGQAPALTHPTNLSSRPMAMPCLISRPRPLLPPILEPLFFCRDSLVRAMMSSDALFAGMPCQGAWGHLKEVAKLEGARAVWKWPHFVSLTGKFGHLLRKWPPPIIPDRDLAAFSRLCRCACKKWSSLLMERQRRPNSRGGGGGPM